VVEVSVVLVEPRSKPRLVLDTLVNPDRRMAATEIHGITDRDVVGAPRFEDVADGLLRALSGCVIAAHNVYFDMTFLRFEMGRLGLFQEVPHVCTRYARRLLGLEACGLGEACRADGINFLPVHTSRSDSTAAALLWMRYRDAFLDRGVVTFGDLTRMGRKYKFFSSFSFGPPSMRQDLKARRGVFQPRP
jgi:DNA polymerase-3 subunit epsilon